MLTMEEAANSTPFDDTLIMNISYDKEQFMERDNKSDVMELPGILATSIVLGLMTLTTIIGDTFFRFWMKSGYYIFWPELRLRH